MKTRHEDAEEQVRLQREALGGVTDLFAEVVGLIVYLRRGEEVEMRFARFDVLVKENVEELVKQMDTRWLVSICDTYMDYGSPVESRNAGIISLLVNMVKLAETERFMLSNKALEAGDVERCGKDIYPLWDGVTSFLITGGDMPRNLFSRLSKLMEPTPVFMRIFEAVMEGMKGNDTLLARLSRHQERFYSERGNA
jgi:hypothetical protein